MEDYSAPFDPKFRLEDLSRSALARLGREYMLYGHIRDRGLMPVVGVRFGIKGVDDVAVDEWMGASPLYTRRMRRAMNITGDDVASIMKSFQLDVGFPHRYMRVGYEVESASVGWFWLDSCGALLDVEPLGEGAVISMCHTMEDPTFPATASAVNPKASILPVHRPPRRPAGRVPHCRWEVRIDPANPPAAEPEMARRVGAGRLAEFALDPPDVAADGGLADYSGDFDPEFQLEQLSRPALVVVCKEFLLQHQLLTRASAIAMSERFGADAVVELLRAQWLAVAPVTTRRLCAAMGIKGKDAGALLKMLQLHPLLPHDYLRLGFERIDDARAAFWVEDCVALDDEEPRGLLSLLDDPDCPGLNAMVAALNPVARCRPMDAAGLGAGRNAWEITIDPSRVPASDPSEGAFLQRSTTTGADLEDPG